MSMKSSDFGPRDYSDGRTKQAYKDQCDINKILKKAQVKGGLSHVQKYPEAVYGEFDGEMDLLTAHERIGKANAIFSELPAEVRREFNNNALEFVQYAGSLSPGELVEKIPAIAEPGDYFPNPVKRGGQGAGAATAPSEAPGEPPQETNVSTPDPTPSNESTGS
jgi:hypothetical protein